MLNYLHCHDRVVIANIKRIDVSMDEFFVLTPTLFVGNKDYFFLIINSGVIDIVAKELRSIAIRTTNFENVVPKLPVRRP